MNREFLLKDNIVMYVGYENMHYTNDNITDEIAVRLLTKNPKLIGNFKKYPTNYESKTILKEKVEIKEEKVLIKNINIEGRKKLIQAVIEKHNKQELMELLKSKNIKYSVTEKKEQLAEKLIDNI